MLLTLLRLVTKKNYKSNPLVMKPMGPYRNIKHVALFSQADTKSFPVVRFTLTNLFYHFEVIANKSKRYSAVLYLVILENEFIQFTQEECPSFPDIDVLQHSLVGFL